MNEIIIAFANTLFIMLLGLAILALGIFIVVVCISFLEVLFKKGK